MKNDIKLNSICQCCLVDDAPMKNMLTETYRDVKLIENFEKCSGIDLFKDQPIETRKNICQKCESNLKVSIEFRELCHTSQEQLKEILAAFNIKDEPVSDDDEQPLVIYSSKKRGSTRSSEIFTHEVFVKVQPQEEDLLIPKPEENKPVVIVQDETVPKDDDDNDYFNNDHFTADHDSDSDENCGAPPTKMAKLETKQSEPPVEDETLTMPVQIMCNRCDKFLPTQNEFFEHRKAHLAELNITVSQCPLDRKCYVCKEEVLGYTKHLREVHRDFKPHTCQQCQMSFEKTTYLAKHLYKHAKVKRLKCLGCKQKFSKLKST
jgi:hypothetical protein